MNRINIIYPYPMHLSNGYTYMLSISQFLNALAEYTPVSLFSLDSKEQFKAYLYDVVDIKLHKKLNITPISNRRFGIKSNRLFFSQNVISAVKEQFSNEEKLVFYTRDFKQMREMLKHKKTLANAIFIFEAHQILSQNHCRDGNYKKAQEMKKLEESVFNQVDGLICITKTLSHEIKKSFPACQAKHFILPVGFSNKFLSIKNTKPKYDLIYSGNFSQWKGLNYLLQALTLVIKQVPNFNAVLIGCQNKEYEEYSAIIKDLNLERNIVLEKRMPHKQIIDYVSQSKMGVLPNGYDGDALLFTSPLKLYEYLGAGLKVVSSKLPPIESIFKHKEDDSLIYWAKPENSESLASALLMAYHDDDYNPQNAQDFAQDYTWEKRAENFLSFCEKLIH